jgi:hypothetical protein
VFRKLLVFSGIVSMAAAGLGAAALASTSGSSACTPATPCITAPTATTAATTGTTHQSTGTTATVTTTPITGPKPKLTLSSRSVVFGSTLKLTGKLPGARAGSVVEILGKSCGFTTSTVIAKAKTSAAGAYSFAMQPARNTVFAARAGNAASAPLAVTVQPKIELRRISLGLYGIDVTVGAGVFFTKAATLQVFDTARHVWRPVASANLHQNSDPGGLLAVSSARIHLNAPSGSKLRASASKATLGSCYQASASAPIGG